MKAAPLAPQNANDVWNSLIYSIKVNNSKVARSTTLIKPWTSELVLASLELQKQISS